eukprot:CAMPEP_0194037432 /NCGR_PEP_ID=MMETSP0009_2-20130614/9782_1 /TAXON_ID=210454 /ORGANISM="Grammatophora oceanica, Strain CCMP 410" /LENGTH=1666 /DNA_ID=CAMNT_0038679591 /DNA_START=197 /DNA_END=5197 /DNA_ORIENTATION=+
MSSGGRGAGGTQNSRRRNTSSTHNHEAYDGSEDAASDDATTTHLATLSTAPTSSWDNGSETEGGADGGESTSRNHNMMNTGRPGSRQDRRKYIDVTTPTLIDEDEEEEGGYDDEDAEEAEIISLEQQAQSRRDGGGDADDSHLRRTPGARMYASLLEQQQRSASVRRTPGAHEMQASAVAAPPSSTAGGSSTGGSTNVAVRPPPPDDSAPLGFGLTLSTPVARGGGGNRTNMSSSNDPRSFTKNFEALSSSSPMKSSRSSSSSGMHHTTEREEDRLSKNYTPAGLTLSKNPHLSVNHGAFSPNTLRLTADLDNLLHDEGEERMLLGGGAAQAAFREGSSRSGGGGGGGASNAAATNWTSNYIFANDGGTASSRNKTGSSGRGSRSRRNKSDNRGARNRNTPSPRLATTTATQPRRMDNATDFSIAHNARQPKPVRSEPYSFNFPQQGKQQQQQQQQSQQQSDSGRTTPQFLGFGGAFAPPSAAAKDSRIFHRPSAVRQQQQQQQPQNAFRRPPAGGQYGSAFQMQQPQTLSQHNPFLTHNSAPPMGMGSSGGGGYGSLPPPPTSHPYMSFGNTGGMSMTANATPGPPPGLQPNMYGSSFHSQPPSGLQGSAYGMPPPPPSHSAPPPTYQQQPPPQPQRWRQQQQQQQQQPPPHQSMPQYGDQRGMAAGWRQQPPPSSMAPPQQQGGRNDWHQQVPPPPQEYGYNPAAGVHQVSVSPTPPFIPNPQYSGWHDGRMKEQQQQQQQQHYAVQHSLRVASPTPSMEGYAATSQQAQPQQQTQQSHRGMAGTATMDKSGGVAGGAMSSNAPAFHPTTQLMSAPAPATSSSSSSSSRSKKDTAQRGKGKQTMGGGKNKESDKGKKAEVAESPSRRSSRRKNTSSPTKGRKGKGSRGGKDNDDDDDGRGVDPAEAKRAELVEDHATRAVFKEFYRKFRAKERTSFKEAEAFAEASLQDPNIPDKVHYKIYLELADLAKRSNRFEEARGLYRKVCEIQPYAGQGWLEYSKLEEECGHLNRCSSILQNGLEYCSLNENLLTRAIKHEEKIGNLAKARQLLARLKPVGIEKVWRTVLEGALLEARAGNHTMARRVLKYLMHHVPWYGPLYLEAYRLEKDLGRTIDALAIVERGLHAIPRYGPLWFAAFRMCETLDLLERNLDLPRTMATYERAKNSISRELTWKIHLETAQILERRATLQASTGGTSTSLDVLLEPCRKQFAMTTMTCQANLCWKVLLAGGRMELAAGNFEKARKLFHRAHRSVPEKGKVATLLECSRLEEFIGNVDRARAILTKSRIEITSDWKVWLESVLVEVRGGEKDRAIDLAKRALQIHTGTGRLWAALVQLRYSEETDETQYAALKKALRAVPKSGEVWCEGGRMNLNPFARCFDLDEARRHLFFATRFTPQYGDSFVESLRLELLEKWLLPVAASMWDAMQTAILKPEDAEKRSVSDLVRLAMQSLLVPKTADEKNAQGDDDDGNATNNSLDAILAETVRESLGQVVGINRVSDELELKCANADPNYGALWFHCRGGPTDTARTTLSRARDLILLDVQANAHVYIAALIRRYGVMAELEHDFNNTNNNNNDEKKKNKEMMTVENLDSLLQSRLLDAPSLSVMLQPGHVDQGSGMVLLEESMNGNNFVTGLVELNKHKPLNGMSLVERKKALFGSDALFS